VRLRRESRLSSEENKPRFEKALTELQTGLKVLPVGIAPAGAWRYAFIYEILPRWYPDVPERAREIDRARARAAILDQYMRNVIASPLISAARLFGWKSTEAQQAAERLAAEGRVELDMKVAGIKELQVVSVAV
jgi:hypothetical protein